MLELTLKTIAVEAQVCFCLWNKSLGRFSNGQPERSSNNTSTDNEIEPHETTPDYIDDGWVSENPPLVAVVPSVVNIADHCLTLATGGNIVPAAIPATREPMSPATSSSDSSCLLTSESDGPASEPLPAPSPDVHLVDAVNDGDVGDQHEEYSPGEPINDMNTLSTRSTPSEFDTDDDTPSDITNAETVSDNCEDSTPVTKKLKLDTTAKPSEFDIDDFTHSEITNDEIVSDNCEDSTPGPVTKKLKLDTTAKQN